MLKERRSCYRENLAGSVTALLLLLALTAGCHHPLGCSRACKAQPHYACAPGQWQYQPTCWGRLLPLTTCPPICEMPPLEHDLPAESLPSPHPPMPPETPGPQVPSVPPETPAEEAPAPPAGLIP